MLRRVRGTSLGAAAVLLLPPHAPGRTSGSSCRSALASPRPSPCGARTGCSLPNSSLPRRRSGSPPASTRTCEGEKEEESVRWFVKPFSAAAPVVRRRPGARVGFASGVGAPVSGPEASRTGDLRPRRRRRGTPLTAPCPTRTSQGHCDPRTSTPRKCPSREPCPCRCQKSRAAASSSPPRPSSGGSRAST